MSVFGGQKPITLAGPVAAIWQQSDGVVLALSQATQALCVLMQLFGADDQVWVPAYFCENGLGPVRRSARLRFYPVTETMAPDWEACEAMLAEGPPHLFILPHFFGIENEAAAARAFCDRTGALLLEDAAHVLRPVGRIGQFGDFATYSPRKFLPIPDGGLLVVRGADLAQRVMAGAAELPSAELPLLRWRALELRDKLLPRSEQLGPLRVRTIEEEPGPADELPSVWMSGFSQRRMTRLGVVGIAEVERDTLRTSRRIVDVMQRFADIESLPRLADAAPYLLGFRARSEAAAADALARLRAAGAMVDTWPGMPPEVRAEPQKYGAAMRIRRTVLRFTPRPRGRRNPLRFIDNLADASVS